MMAGLFTFTSKTLFIRLGKYSLIVIIVVLLLVVIQYNVLSSNSYVYGISHGEKACLIDDHSKELIKYMLRNWFETCREFNVTTWLESGTLLGAFKLGHILPWDHDADIAYLYSQFHTVHTLVRLRLIQKGISVNTGNKLVSLHMKHTFVDVFCYGTPDELIGYGALSRNAARTLDNNMLSRIFFRNSMFFESTYQDKRTKDLFPLQTCMLNNITAYCPRDIQTTLAKNYPYTHFLPVPVPFKLNCYLKPWQFFGQKSAWNFGRF